MKEEASIEIFLLKLNKLDILNKKVKLIFKYSFLKFRNNILFRIELVVKFHQNNR